MAVFLCSGRLKFWCFLSLKYISSTFCRICMGERTPGFEGQDGAG